LKNWNCALVSAKRENARIKSERLDDNDMAVVMSPAAIAGIPGTRRL
jgi:hypothetical protein